MFDSSNYTEQTKKCLKKLGITENTVCQCGAGMEEMSFISLNYGVSMFSSIGGHRLNSFFAGSFPTLTLQLVCENCGIVVKTFTNRNSKK